MGSDILSCYQYVSDVAQSNYTLSGFCGKLPQWMERMVFYQFKGIT